MQMRLWEQPKFPKLRQLFEKYDILPDSENRLGCFSAARASSCVPKRISSAIFVLLGSINNVVCLNVDQPQTILNPLRCSGWWGPLAEPARNPLLGLREPLFV